MSKGKFVLESILVCPICKGKLDPLGHEGYKCSACEVIYPIEEGIPIFLRPNLKEFKRLEAEHHSLTADDYAEAHQLHTLRVNYYHEDFLSAFNFLENADLILEVGAGIGKDGLELMKRGFNVVETDVSKGILIKARESFRSLSRDLSGVYAVADAECLPFDDDSFDGALIVASLHHLPNPMKFLLEINRCLKDEGTLVIGFEPNSWQFYTIYAIFRFLRRSWWTLKKVLGNWSRADVFPNKSIADAETLGYSYWKLKRMGKNANFQPVRIKSVWYVIGFINLLLEILYRSLRLKRRIELPLLFEKSIIEIDEKINDLPLLRFFGWHWNVVAKKRVTFEDSY